jgi:hypothetical protein
MRRAEKTNMEISKTSKFLSDRGVQVVMVAVTLAILGAGSLAWILMPTPAMAYTARSRTGSAYCRSLDVMAAFRAAGLSAEAVHSASKDERDGLSTHIVVDARRFRISANDEEMGMVLCFKNRWDREQMQKYYLTLNRSFPRFRSWLFVKDKLILQINKEVPEHRARAYGAVLDTIGQ